MEKTLNEVHTLISDHFISFKDDLNKYLKDNEENIIQNRKNFYEPQIKQLEDEIKNLKDHYDEMERNTAQYTTELVRKENILNKMVNRSSKLHAKVRNNNIASRSFHNWIDIGTDKNILINSFKKIYLENPQKRIMFKRWIRKTNSKREYRFLNETKQKFEKEAKIKSLESNKQISLLEKELLFAKEELEKKQKNFKEMQQRLRKAFMRGVVNLNLEAMDVFNGAQFMKVTEEIEGGENSSENYSENIEDVDDEFFVEETPNISIIRHK